MKTSHSRVQTDQLIRRCWLGRKNEVVKRKMSIKRSNLVPIGATSLLVGLMVVSSRLLLVGASHLN